MGNLKLDDNRVIEVNNYVSNGVNNVDWIPIDHAEKLWINGVNIIFGKTFQS